MLEGVKLKTRDLSKLRADVVRRAGETYCKFLASGDEEIRRLAISIDNTAVEAVDPLHRENPETKLFYKREKVDFDDGSSAFFTAVALPHPNTLSDELARRYRYHGKIRAPTCTATGDWSVLEKPLGCFHVTSTSMPTA